MRAHPYADKFPMLPDAELAELAESIRANGLRQPVVVTADDLILDGRNRAVACEMVGVEPETVVYEGDDLAEYVIDCNVTRRNMSTGARAMATALVLAADGRRDGGRWQYGTVTENPEVGKSFQNALAQCGVVLDYCPDVATDVVNGDVSLNAAFDTADGIRRSAESEKVREREEKRRRREESAEEAKRNAQIVADLTAAESPFLADISAGRMTPAVAWAAHQEATRKEREAQRQIEHGIRTTNTHMAEAIRTIAVQQPGDVFLREFWPHHNEYVVEGMRITRERCEEAITVLSAIVKEMQK